MTPRLKETYFKEIIPKMMEEFNFGNRFEVPRVKKVVLNMGLGRAVIDPKVIGVAVEEIGRITGQKAVVTRAKKAIANFKLRRGLAIGCMVTLRKRYMYEFLDRLFNIALPRVRDFKGLSPKSFDQAGNYTIGIKEHIIFPEIDYDKVEKMFGMNITLVTTAKKTNEARKLLSLLGMPFREN